MINVPASARVITGIRSLNDTVMQIHFLVLGGGVSGLSAAISLRRAGHRVTVLEVADHFEKTWGPDGGVAITPNMSKVLVRWGMEAELDARGVHIRSVTFRRFESGDTLGMHHLQEELLRDCGGDFFYADYAELWQLMRESALAHGVALAHRGVEVASISVEEDARPSVTLSSGEVLEADIIVAADGPDGVARQALDIDLDSDARDKPLDLSVFKMVIAREDMAREPLLAPFLTESHAINTWFGDGRGAVAYNSGKNGTVVLQVYAPGPNTKDLWGKQVDSARVLESMGKSDPQIEKMVSLVKSATCHPVIQPAPLESWVHSSERLVLIGDAAHPFPCGSMHTLSPNIGDGAALSALFTHLHHPGQTARFLGAFDGLRGPRVQDVLDVEVNRLLLISMPDGEMQRYRDASVRRNHARGVDAFAGEDGDLLPAWEEDKKIFAYDPEEHAEEWWNDWGLLQERSREGQISSPLDALRVQVDSQSREVMVGAH